MAQVIDIRTRKLGDGKVEAVAITDQLDDQGDPVVIKGHGNSPDEAIADANAQAAGAQTAPR